jgi:large subunit ribosomal protein LP0
MSKRDRKEEYCVKLRALLDKYNKVLVVNADNVGSHHMQKIRESIRGKGILLMGKNTMIRRVIRTEYKKFEVLLPFVVDNIGLLFTEGDLTEVRDAVLSQRVAAPAKAGAVAPVDVTVPAGDTGLEPTQTAFLQALNIATRINKGQIAILNEKKVIIAGEKVGPSEAALLQKLKIKPFSYGLALRQIFEDGLVYEPAVLDLSNEDLYKKLASAATKIAQLSLEIGYPTLPSIPHSLTRAFKSLVSIAVTTEITFSQAEDIKELLENPEALAAALAAPAAAAPAAASAAPAAAAPAEESESDEDMGFGLFD